MAKTERISEAIREMKFRLFSEQSGICFSCGQAVSITAMELAHRISKSKTNLKLLGEAVIHHRWNLRGTHSGRCNSFVSISADSEAGRRLIYDIQKAIKKEKDRRYAR